MAYRVDISPSALQDAEDAFLWIREQSPTRAGDWFKGLLESIYSLETFPTRCSIAPESQEVGFKIRQLLYGKRKFIYRILFTVGYDEKTDEDVVRVYRIRHIARRSLNADEIAKAEAEDEEA
jgi:plasmid stabilization system protein ParE